MFKTENNLPTKKEFSSGGVVYKRQETRDKQQQLVWLLGKHSGYHKWVLPKGRIEGGEDEIETAVRETKEELGVTAKVIGTEPIHTEKYWFMAEEKQQETNDKDQKVKPERRYKTYQENEGFGQTTQKIKVDKTVTFFLMEYVSGDPSEHDWEMDDAGWFSYEEAMEKLAFEGEKKALEKARKSLLA